MKIFTPPFYSRKINFLLLGGLILFLSCQSDPIVYNPTGGYEYQKKSFQINNETSETVQGDLHTGMSPRLYSGILSNGNTVSTLIRLLPQVLESHQVCDSVDIVNVKILLTSITPIAVKEDTIITDTLFQFNTALTPRAHFMLYFYRPISSYEPNHRCRKYPDKICRLRKRHLASAQDSHQRRFSRGAGSIGTGVFKNYTLYRCRYR